MLSFHYARPYVAEKVRELSGVSSQKGTNPIYEAAPLKGHPRWLSSKESACNAGDVASIPGSGRSPGGGNGDPLQYSRLENAMDRGPTHLPKTPPPDTFTSGIRL